MPRKNARPAAKKARKKMKARMAGQKSRETKPRVGVIAHAPYGGLSLALAAAALAYNTKEAGDG